MWSVTELTGVHTISDLFTWRDVIGYLLCNMAVCVWLVGEVWKRTVKSCLQKIGEHVVMNYTRINKPRLQKPNNIVL